MWTDRQTYRQNGWLKYRSTKKQLHLRYILGVLPHHYERMIFQMIEKCDLFNSSGQISIVVV